MSNKITKIAMIEAIEQHLLERNQRLTNLKKISFERLEQRVNEFNIDMNKFIKERNQKLNEEKEQRKQKKIKENEEYQEALERKEYIENHQGILNYYWQDISNKIICNEQLKSSRNYQINRYVLYVDYYKNGIFDNLVNKFKDYQTYHRITYKYSYSIDKKLREYQEKLKNEQEENIKNFSLKEYINKVKEIKEEEIEEEEIKEEEIKEEIKEERKPSTKNDKFLCSCGSYCRKDNKARHIKTIKHQEYLKSL